jgi:hypothetical protein
VVAQSPGGDYLTPSEISDILADCCGIAIPRQRVSSILEQAGAAVARRRTGKRNRYKIMKRGLDAFAAGSAGPLLVDPQNALTHIRSIEAIFGGLRGVVRVCDPYVDNRTLDVMSCCISADEVRILSVNVQRESALRRDLAAFRQEHSVPIVIRIAPPGKHHDRYVIADQTALQFGASLNGIARKQSFIVPLGTNMRDLLIKAFDADWATSTEFK